MEIKLHLLGLDGLLNVRWGCSVLCLLYLAGIQQPPNLFDIKYVGMNRPQWRMFHPLWCLDGAAVTGVYMVALPVWNPLNLLAIMSNFTNKIVNILRVSPLCSVWSASCALEMTLNYSSCTTNYILSVVTCWCAQTHRSETNLLLVEC